MNKCCRLIVAISCGLLAYLPLHAQDKQPSKRYRESRDSSGIKIRKESKFFVNVRGGYGFALGSTFRFFPDDVKSIAVEMQGNRVTSRRASYEATKKGLGEGFRYGIGLNYIINDFLNVGVDVDYFRTNVGKSKDSTMIQRTTVAGVPVTTTYNENYTNAYDASTILVSPNITFKAISRPKYYVYNKIGFVLTANPNIKQNEDQDINVRVERQGFFRDSAAIVNREYEWTIRNPAVGFIGGVGFQVKLLERLRAFAEVQFTYIVFVVQKRSLVSAKLNGQERISTVPVALREVEFVNDYTTSQTAQDPNQPTKTIVQRIPTTYISFTGGLAYRF